MALAAMLSAMRTIILESPTLPESEEARRLTYHVLFPDLSSPEVEDLAKIPPQRFHIYTRSIFSGEADLISHYHAMTCALIERAMQKRSKQAFSMRDFVRTMHTTHPWKSSTTEGLLESFARYLQDKASEFGEFSRRILESAQFEHHLFVARRHPDNDHKPSASVDRNKLAKLTVGEVLELDWHIPATTSFQQFTFDIPAAYSYFHTHKGVLPPTIVQKHMYVMFGRDARHTVRWKEIPEELFTYFTKQSHGADRLDGVAARFVESLPPGLSEQESFAQFINFGVDLIEAGLVVVHT
ncbi:MAG: hypothetical protein J0M12_05750 [Deltaproteobacteria bacterium]|nr:hypothetical protein [Deltaproteobacteria bacterium]